MEIVYQNPDAVGERVFANAAYQCYQRNHRGRRMSTPGSSKNEWCQTNPQKKFFACNVKARYHPMYSVWHKKFVDINMGRKT